MLPDLVGYKLHEVIEILKSKNINDYDIIVTKPPWDKEDLVNGEFRVLRIKKDETSKFLKVLVSK